MISGRRVVAGLAAAGLAVALLAGCQAPAAEPPPEGPAPEATLGFTQLLPKEGTRDALLRVTNTGEAELDVTSVAIEWPGYPDGTPSPADPSLAPGRTLDIQLQLPDPACDPPGSEDVIGVVETEQGTIRHELEATGTTYVQPAVADPVRGRPGAERGGDLLLEFLAGRRRRDRRPRPG